MKKKILFVLVLVLSVGFQVDAQLLWKISGNGIKKSSYLLGTHHAASMDICDGLEGFEKAFKGSKSFYGELVMDDLQAMAQKMAKYMILPQDSLLDVLLTQEQYKKVDELLKKEFKMGVEQFKMLKPMALLSQLTMVVNAKIFKDFDPNNQLDGMLQKKAKENKIPVNGFETVEQQSELLFGASLKDQTDALVNFIEHFDMAEQQSIDLKNAYVNQDLDAIFKLTEDPDFSPFLEELVYKRNRNWIEQLNTLMAKQPVFIAVGAAHLPGDQGMIELLRKQGYSVTPVK